MSKNKSSHVIADCRLTEKAPPWIKCECGSVILAGDLDALHHDFQDHRVQMGERRRQAGALDLNPAPGAMDFRRRFSVNGGV